MVEPGARQLGRFAVRNLHPGIQERRKVHDVKSPENGLQLPQLIFPQVGRVQFRPSADVVNVREEGGILGLHNDVRAVILQFLIDLFFHAQDHVQHPGGQGGAQRDGQLDQQHFPLLVEEHAPYHPEQHVDILPI